MAEMDLSALRGTISQLTTDHDAEGEHRPKVGEVFAPEQHASALAPSTLIVVGARGAGKSFWAGVLGQDETRTLAASVYPRLGLERLLVRFGYNGFDTGSAVSRRTVEARVRTGDQQQATFFWQAVILRAAFEAVDHPDGSMTTLEVMQKYEDPELFEGALRAVDAVLTGRDKTLLVIFDALDTLSREWGQLTILTDALFEAAWSLRARRCIRAKIFIRPDQLNDESLRFVELPKLKSGRVELNWKRVDLYGLLYSRMAEAEQRMGGDQFNKLAVEEGSPLPHDEATRLRSWRLARDETAQRRIMQRLAGLYMGRGPNKGATYPWTYNHLADARGVVTPRSFLKLFVEAARYAEHASNLVLTPEAIRHGLREASKTRVEQLALEYRWVKRALAPLAGLKVPCQRSDIHDVWRQSNTVDVITKTAQLEGFLPPYKFLSSSTGEETLEGAMERIGVLSYRADGRVDMPDLFRIASKMFKLGGVALQPKALE